ncbi:MAG: alkaline phosphatase D family protein [Micromonosporaceae bacterium]
MARLLLGPVLRWVDPHRATLWVQTDRPCRVAVDAGPAGGAAETFTAFGHHYALVVVDGLTPGSSTPYQVVLDEQPVWPEPGSRFPASVIRTPVPDGPARLVFGSCREASPYTTDRSYPPDALDTYAAELAAGDAPAPDYLLLLGDQVYADEITPRTRRYLRRRRRDTGGPVTEVADFTEYTQLYLESWTDPELRWLLSTVPSMMIFDDHEIIDDWNTSAAWRRQIRRLPWWRDRIAGGLASYWIYQHLGNLSPDALATDPTFHAVRAAPDAAGVLTEFALAADAEGDGSPGPRWSFRIDLGGTRVIVLDTRCSRVLEESARDMLPESEWAWFTEQLTGDYRHLVVGSSLPWLLPPAIHEVEGVNEKLCRSRVPGLARLSEKLRQAADLEHWAAFRGSFDRLGGLLTDVAAGRFTPRPPGSVSVLSGDVHHSYAARLNDAPVHQLTCSPIHNDVPHAMRWGFRFGWSRTAALIGIALARLSGRGGSPYRWRRLAGPYFENAVGMLVHDGPHARLALRGTRWLPGGGTALTTLDEVPLSQDSDRSS